MSCSQYLKNRLKRLKQCSRCSWDWRKGKEEDTNSHNRNWRYVTGLHLRPTRIFSFLDNNAAKSWDCQADRKLNVAFIFPAFPFYSTTSFALRFLLSEPLLHWALFCPPPKLPLLSKCEFSQDWVKSCAFFSPFCNYTSLLPFPNLHVWETTGGGSLEVLLVYRCPTKNSKVVVRGRGAGSYELLSLSTRSRSSQGDIHHHLLRHSSLLQCSRSEHVVALLSHFNPSFVKHSLDFKSCRFQAVTLTRQMQFVALSRWLKPLKEKKGNSFPSQGLCHF